MSNKHLLRVLYYDQGGNCYYCGRAMSFTRGRTRATIDHLTPRCAGGQDERDNLVAACLECNGAKASRTEEEFLALLRKRHRGVGERRREKRIRMLSYAIRKAHAQ